MTATAPQMDLSDRDHDRTARLKDDRDHDRTARIKDDRDHTAPHAVTAWLTAPHHMTALWPQMTAMLIRIEMQECNLNANANTTVLKNIWKQN